MGILREFRGAPVGDRRLQDRLVRIGELVATEPAASFPRMARSDGELEAIYRFLNNPRVEFADILQPHIQATYARAARVAEVIVAHDTTDFVFSGAVEDDLGYLPSGRGFLGHFALVLDRESVQPLGVGGAKTWARWKPLPGRGQGKQKESGGTLAKKPERESMRWVEMVEAVERDLPSGTRAIHTMDREGDSYAIFAALTTARRRFVTRLKQMHDRSAAEVLGDEWERMGDVIDRAEYVLERRVLLSKRAAKTVPNKRYGSRRMRWAKLRVDAMPIVLRRPNYLSEPTPHELTLRLVRVREIDPPVDEEPVEWWLITSESIETREDVERVVDAYRARWKIEEYFKALKTGCGYEKRGLESYAALLRTLAVLIPIAWQLLALRDRGRATPDAPATVVFSLRQLRVLRGLSKRLTSDMPSLEEALLAVAGEGGHLLRNGPPGWQSLGRGLEKLWWAEVGYAMALADAAKLKVKM